MDDDHLYQIWNCTKRINTKSLLIISCLSFFLRDDLNLPAPQSSTLALLDDKLQ